MLIVPFVFLFIIDITPFIIYPLISISIAIPTYKIWGKWYILISVIPFTIVLIVIAGAFINNSGYMCMSLVIIFYLVPFVINFVSYLYLLRHWEEISWLYIVNCPKCSLPVGVARAFKIGYYPHCNLKMDVSDPSE